MKELIENLEIVYDRNKYMMSMTDAGLLFDTIQKLKELEKIENDWEEAERLEKDEPFNQPLDKPLEL